MLSSVMNYLFFLFGCVSSLRSDVLTFMFEPEDTNAADAVLLEGLKITGVWLRLKLLTFTRRNPSRFLKWLYIMHFKVKYVNPLRNVTFKCLQFFILEVVGKLQIPGESFYLLKINRCAKAAFWPHLFFSYY